jgi:hypothetical protein
MLRTVIFSFSSATELSSSPLSRLNNSLSGAVDIGQGLHVLKMKSPQPHLQFSMSVFSPTLDTWKPPPMIKTQVFFLLKAIIQLANNFLYQLFARHQPMTGNSVLFISNN